MMSALGGVEMAMRDAGIKFKAGSGVGAAVDYYRSTAKAIPAFSAPKKAAPKKTAPKKAAAKKAAPKAPKTAAKK